MFIFFCLGSPVVGKGIDTMIALDRSEFEAYLKACELFGWGQTFTKLLYKAQSVGYL